MVEDEVPEVIVVVRALGRGDAGHLRDQLVWRAEMGGFASFGWGRECSGESSRDLVGRADARLVWLFWWPSAAWRSDTDGGREIE